MTENAMRAGKEKLGFVGVLLLAVVLAAPGAMRSLHAQAELDPHAGHDHGKTFRPEDFTREQKARIERLFTLVICSCPRENWTKTLAGCPDPCANHQKNEVRALILDGKTDREIIDAQLAAHGEQVLGRTPASGLSGFYVYVFPFVVLAGLLIAVVLVLKSVIRPADSAAASSRRASEADNDAAAQIERELEEMD